MSNIFIYISHKNGVIDDSAYELKLAARKIDPNASVVGIITGYGSELGDVAKFAISFCEEVWIFDNPQLAYPNAEISRKLLHKILPSNSIFILSHSTFGMDLAPGLSIKINASLLPDILDIEEVSNGIMRVIRQEFGGMVYAHIECNILSGVVLTLRPGAFISEEDIEVNGIVVDQSALVGDLSVKRNFLEIVEPEVGEVDITKSDVLVSVGRGIEDEDNIEIVQDLADVLGAVVSCSRPIVDAKWMGKSRQVGTSGQTVKPKVYIACGISGSFQHMGGIKGSTFIIAINKNRKAPIFQVADVGVEADLLDFIPELTDAIKEL